jgi:hypothetical protein
LKFAYPDIEFDEEKFITKKSMKTITLPSPRFLTTILLFVFTFYLQKWKKQNGRFGMTETACVISLILSQQARDSIL